MTNKIKKQLTKTPAFQGCCGFLSNFSPYSENERIKDEFGIHYQSNEHFYQAMKFSDKETRYKIANHPSKGLKAFCRSLGSIVANWDDVKIGYMKRGLYHKFAIPRYKQLLLLTGNEPLIETNTWGDKFWGVYQGDGENVLGKLLMEIRNDLDKPVSLKLAILANKLEFSENCRYAYDTTMGDQLDCASDLIGDTFFTTIDIKNALDNEHSCYLAPTQTQLKLWLEDKYGVQITVHEKNKLWGFSVEIPINKDDFHSDFIYDKDDYALENALEYCLIILINQKS